MIQDDSAHVHSEKAQHVTCCRRGVLPLQQVSSEVDEQKGCSGLQPLSRRLERNHETPRLFVEDEDAGLAGKTDFLHLPVFAEEQRIIR